MSVETVIEAPGWAQADLESLVQSACDKTLTHLGHDPAGFEVAVLGCDDDRIAALNADFRGKAAPTNVLSWPADDLAAEEDGALPHPPVPDFDDLPIELGDIAIAFETCQREAGEQGKSFNDHVTHLVVHGLLHLMGYDHIRPKDAALMEGLEIEILAKLGVSDPYG